MRTGNGVIETAKIAVVQVKLPSSGPLGPVTSSCLMASATDYLYGPVARKFICSDLGFVDHSVVLVVGLVRGSHTKK